MCELDILHDSLYQFCPELHLKRLNSLTLACHALLDCKTLTLTELGRNLPTKARTKHNIKRIDRLLGNRHLHKERLAVYRWHASFICSGNTMPIVLGVVCGRGRNPTLRLWPTIFSGKIDVFPGDRRSRLISSMTSVAPA